jgi:hypothetical protein
MDGYQEFTTFATQDDAAKVNAPGAKTYVAAEDSKGWFDPNPEDGTEGKFNFTMGDKLMVFYPRVFLGKMTDQGVGITVSLVIAAEFAKRVNIPPTGPLMTNVPGTGKVTPVPLKALAATQVLLRPNPFSPFQVRNTDVPLAEEAAQQGAADTLATLKRVETKVDKIMTKFGIV